MKDVITQRYTSSTCTLEVVGRRSALSRWATLPVLKPLRFRLYVSNSEVSGVDQVLIRGDRTQLEGLMEAVQTYVQAKLTPIAAASGCKTSDSASPLSGTSPADHSQENSESTAASLGILLQSQGLTRHILRLGALATNSIGVEIRLSTLQLFDLTHIFDEYEASAIVLPPLPSTASHRHHRLTTRIGWSGVAAATILITVGLTTTLTRWLRDNPLASSPMATIRPEEMDDSELGDREEHSIAAQPFEDIQTESVAPLNPIESAEETYHPPQLAESSYQLPPEPSEQSPQKSEPSLSTNQPQTQPSPSAPATSPAPPAPAASPAPATSPAPPLPEPPVTSQPPLPDPIPPTPTVSELSEAAFADSPANAAASSADAQMAPPLASIGSTRAERPLPEAASRALSIEESASGRAPAPIPQIAEIKDYFQQRWSLPENLNQVLAYRLVISPAGTIESITPISSVAETYRDRITLPLPNEPISSPIQTEESLSLRLVFGPNGAVIVFQD